MSSLGIIVQNEGRISSGGRNQSQSQSTDKLKSSLAKHSRANRLPEVRCYKYSPQVKPRLAHPTIERHDFQMKEWQKTFDTMGRLYLLGKGDDAPVGKLSQVPYHCSCLARTFKAAFGQLSQVEGASVKGVHRPQKKETKRSPTCINVDKSYFPLVMRHTSVLEPMKRIRYIPKSTVRVRWGVGPKLPTFTAEDICEWLTNFGTVLFRVNEGRHSFLAVFEDIMSAYRAVTCPVVPAKVCVSWNDRKFHNYGHLSFYKNYKVSEDKVWQRSMSNRPTLKLSQSKSREQRNSSLKPPARSMTVSK